MMRNDHLLLFFKFPYQLVDTRMTFFKSFLSLYDNLEMNPPSFTKMLKDINNPLSAIKENIDVDYNSILDDFIRAISREKKYLSLFIDEYEVLKKLKQKASLYVYCLKEDLELFELDSKSDLKKLLMDLDINSFFSNFLIIDNRYEMKNTLLNYIEKEGYETKDALLLNDNSQIDYIDNIKFLIDNNGSCDINSFKKLYEVLNA